MGNLRNERAKVGKMRNGNCENVQQCEQRANSQRRAKHLRQGWRRNEVISQPHTQRSKRRMATSKSTAVRNIYIKRVCVQFHGYWPVAGLNRSPADRCN